MYLVGLFSYSLCLFIILFGGIRLLVLMKLYFFIMVLLSMVVCMLIR